MLVTPKGKIVARSGKLKVRKLTGSPSASFVIGVLQQLMLECGWQRTLTGTFFSQGWDHSMATSILIAGEQKPFEGRIFVDMVDVPNEVQFRVRSMYDLAVQDSSLPLRFRVCPEVWLFVSPFQFIIFPEVGASGNNGIFVSSLKIPSFAYNNPWIQALVACESERLTSDYLTQAFDTRVFTAVLKADGSAYYWTVPSPGVGQVLFYRLTNDSFIAYRVNAPIKHPLFVGWGTSNSTTLPTIKGFAWDMLFLLDHNTIPLRKSFLMDRSEIFPLSRHFDNVLCMELRYGIPANA